MVHLSTTIGLLLILLSCWLAWVSLREGEIRAARRSLLLALILLVIYGGTLLLPESWRVAAGFLLVGGPLLTAVILVWPTGCRGDFGDERPVGPAVDERTIMFSRAELQPGSDRFAAYYRDHPEHRVDDDHWRSLPGLMDPASGKFAPVAMAAAAASFRTVEELASLIEGPAAAERKQTDPRRITDFLIGWARKLGAADCGVTKLAPYHFYTHKGRGHRYAEPLRQRHSFGLAFTVEMDHVNLGTAPEGPALMESAQQYLAAGQVAAQVAQFIRELGWPATAHIDGHYEVICPLVARDAGLGEIGRMGLLMTPRLGPRVRLAVVTTDLPLLPSPRDFDPTVLDFCDACRKCAEICPSGAIPSGDRQEVSGVPRWVLDHQACFTFWCAAGTDCGQCMRVCPYSHPDSLLHNLVRRGLRHSTLFRSFARRMDDLLYGRRPAPRPGPAWLGPRQAP